MKPAYRLTFPDRDTVISKPDDRLLLTHLTVALDMDVPADSATFIIDPTLDLDLGLTLEVHLGYGDVLVQVFAGSIVRVEPGLQQQRVIAHSPAQALLDYRVNQTYEDCTAGEIVRELAYQSGVPVAVVEDGAFFDTYYVDDRRSTYAHMQTLAGDADIYLNAAGALVCKRYTLGEQTHTLTYGQDILTLDEHTVTTLGNPDIRLGDALRLVGTPNDGLYPVRGVTHRLTKQAGFTTTIHGGTR